MTVKKDDFIDQLKEKYGYTKKDGAEIIEDVFDLILDNLENGNSVSIIGFGCFDLHRRAARSCPNPAGKDMCFIPEHWVPRFRPGKVMRRAVKIYNDNVERGLAD
jgi:nucleoid DNA-binding protein